MLKVAAAVIFLVFLINGTSLGFSDGDFQWWNTLEFSTDLSDQWRATLEEETRLGNGGGSLYYQHSDIGFAWSGLTDWIDLGFNFRQVNEEDSEGTCRPEYRPHFNVTFKNLLGHDLSNRSRVEYRDRDTSPDVWRYRNKTTYRFPFTLTDWKLKPYIADEIFIEEDSRNMSRNRFYAGVGFNITESIKGEVFYLLQSSRDDGRWNDVNVLGTKIKFDF
jgi:hypothetical protein